MKKFLKLLHDRLPRKLKVLHSIWKVEIRPERDMEDTIGKTWKEDNIIQLHKGAPPSEFADAAWHEMTHALFWAMGISEAEAPPKVEEAVVRKLCTAQLTLLVDNPALLDWLVLYVKELQTQSALLKAPEEEIEPISTRTL